MLCPLRLHILDFIVGTLPFLRLCKALYALHHDASIPGAVKNSDIARRRQMKPKAPLIMELLLDHVRRCHGVYSKAQRVKRSRQTADSTALACCIPALKADDYRYLLLEHFNLQLRQLLLVLIELLLIFLLRQHLIRINLAQNIVVRGRTHRRSSLGLRRMDSVFNSFYQSREHVNTRTASILSGNQMPRSIDLIRRLQHPLVALQIGRISLALIKRRTQITPGLAQGFGVLVNIFLLLLIRQMQEEFYHEIVIIRQHLLEVIDMLIGNIQAFAPVAMSAHLMRILQIIPAAVVHSDMPQRRQVTPKEGEKRLLMLLLTHTHSRINIEAARIHLLHHLVNQGAAAYSTPTLEHDEHRLLRITRQALRPA